MPITEDIRDHEVLGREFKRGFAQGLELARNERLRRFVRRQAEARFGTLPLWASQRLDELSGAEIEEIGLKLITASTLEDVLR